jgi:hypothetical protein
MEDNDGTPLSKKAETISYSEIHSTPEDRQRVSLNKAYAERSEYVDDPTANTKPSLAERVKQKVRQKYSEVKSNVNVRVKNAKEGITVNNAKKVGARVVQNVSTNLKEDVEFGARQGISSVKNIGLTEKQSVAKYGDVQYPRLFGGEGGGFGDLITSDKQDVRRHITTVKGRSNRANLDVIAANNKNIASGKYNPLDAFKKPKEGKTKKIVYKNKKVVSKTKSKNMSVNFGNINSTGNINSVAVVDALGNMSRHSSRPKAVSFEQIGITTNVFKNKTHKSSSTMNIGSPLDRMYKSPKPLKEKKVKYSNMDNSSGLFELNMFGKKKKGGLF